MPTTKKTTTTPSAKKAVTSKAPASKTAAPKKPRVQRTPKTAAESPVKAETNNEAIQTQIEHVQKLEQAPKIVKSGDGRYVYATGRRKTSVANIRMFYGGEKSTVNKKDILAYFGNSVFVTQAFKPLQLTGLEGQVYVYVNANGGGLNSQSHAIAHGISLAIAESQPDFRKVLKKNGMLTRDSRMKERKKPGLKRARRGPQWAKR